MAIPEFILRKLVVPGSLKKKGNGFTFIINNTFAPATIQKFELLNDDTLIKPETISFSTPDSETKKASQINNVSGGTNRIKPGPKSSSIPIKKVNENLLPEKVVSVK